MGFLFSLLDCVAPFVPVIINAPACVLISLFPDRWWPCYGVSVLGSVFCVRFLVRASSFPHSWHGALVALIPVVVWVALVFL